MSLGVPDPPTAVFRIQHEAEFVLDHGLADDVRLHCQVANEVSPHPPGNGGAEAMDCYGTKDGQIDDEIATILRT